MTTNDFLFCRGDIGRIDLTEPVLDLSGRMRGLTVAWAKESILECGRAASVDTGVDAVFTRKKSAEQMNNMLEGMKRLCPDDTSLRSDKVFSFIRDDVHLFGDNRTLDLGTRYQDSWEASTLYGREISQFIGGSPFYTSNFSVSSENNVFGGRTYMPYVKTLSPGDKFDILQLAYTFANPFSLRLRRFVRHFDLQTLSRMHGNPIYSVTAGGRVSIVSPEVGTKYEVIPLTKTTISSGAVYDIENTYGTHGNCEKWHVLHINEMVYNWSTQALSKSVERYILILSNDSSGLSVTGYELVECARSALSLLGISDSDIFEPTLAQVKSWTRPAHVNPYTLQSSISVSYVGCYAAYFLRDRTIRPWQRH